VLVVDDHPDTADVIAMMMRTLGHECRTATTGEDGLALAHEMRPDIALLDIGMPDLSGYELARSLRARLGNSVYLAAITGWGEPSDRARAYAAGFDLHVIKPASGVMINDILLTAERHFSAADPT